MRIDGALGFFQETSPSNNNNNNKKINSVWGPVPGPTVPGPKMAPLQLLTLLWNILLAYKGDTGNFQVI